MDRVRGKRPRAGRLGQGRDRPGHSDRPHPDRRRRAGRAAGPDQPGVRPDRREPGGGLHLGQLFDRGRRRVDPPGLRRGALAVPRTARRDVALPGGRTVDRGWKIPALRQGHRARLLVDGGRDRSSAARAAPRRSRRRRATGSSASTCRGSTCRRRSRVQASSTTSLSRTCCMPACCGSPGAARISRRSTKRRAEGGERADRDFPRRRICCVDLGQRNRCDALIRGGPHAGALGGRLAAAVQRGHTRVAEGGKVT